MYVAERKTDQQWEQEQIQQQELSVKTAEIKRKNSLFINNYWEDFSKCELIGIFVQ